jgi:hypothetical protein
MSIISILPFVVIPVISIFGIKKTNQVEIKCDKKNDNNDWRKQYEKTIEEMWDEETFIRQQLDVSTIDCEQCYTNERICKCAKKQFIAELTLKNVKQWGK